MGIEQLWQYTEVPLYLLFLWGGWKGIKALWDRNIAKDTEIQVLNEKRITDLQDLITKTNGAIDRLQQAVNAMLQALAGRHDHD